MDMAVGRDQIGLSEKVRKLEVLTNILYVQGGKQHF